MGINVIHICHLCDREIEGDNYCICDTDEDEVVYCCLECMGDLKEGDR